MKIETFNNILQKGESDIVDFKEKNYFSTNDKNETNKFIKDILSLTNTIRDENAYIIIGVNDNNEKIGIQPEEFIDGAVLQSKIKDKVSPIPKFNTYRLLDDDGKLFQIIELPVVWYSSPCQPTYNSESITKGETYIRRDSSNAKAGYDDILKLSSWLSSLPRLAELNSKARKKNDEISEFRFDEITIQKLFGNEAAEDESTERLKEYYFKNDIFNKIAVDLPLRILVGHKGIGKSALFNVSIIEDKEMGKVPIKIKPDDVNDLGKSSEEFSDVIRSWRKGLLHIIFKKTLTFFGIKGLDLEVLSFEESSFIESILEILQEYEQNGKLNDKNIILYEKFIENPIINIYIDDLDRGWNGNKSDINKISAILNAVRDIINDEESKRLQFKISLRSDVYFLYRTSDESTDKTQSSVIWYKWTQHEILGLLVKRVRTFFNKDVDENLLKTAHQADLAKNLTEIIEPIFSGQGKWENKEMYKVLLSVIRKRPRDLVKLLTLAARNANNRKSKIITTQDLKAIFDEYSLDRIQDTINEYKSELPHIDRLIFGLKPDRKAVRASDSFYYNTPSLLLKINKIIERGEFKFSSGKIAYAKDLAAFLYKINFITATKTLSDGFIERKDFEENRYLVPKFEDFGYDWEVHMAFRWGLQPSEQNNIYSII